jgi:hypothetical protein
MKAVVGNRLPAFTEQQKAALKGSAGAPHGWHGLACSTRCPTVLLIYVSDWCWCACLPPTWRPSPCTLGVGCCGGCCRDCLTPLPVCVCVCVCACVTDFLGLNHYTTVLAYAPATNTSGTRVVEQRNTTHRDTACACALTGGRAGRLMITAARQP